MSLHKASVGTLKAGKGSPEPFRFKAQGLNGATFQRPLVKGRKDWASLSILFHVKCGCGLVGGPNLPHQRFGPSLLEKSYSLIR